MTGNFFRYCGNTGVDRHRNESQHRKLTLEKKDLPIVPTGIRTRDLSMTIPVLYH